MSEEKKSFNQRVIEAARGGKITKKDLMRATHLKKKDMDECLESLQESGEINLVTVSNPHGFASVWVILATDIEKTNKVYSVYNDITSITSLQKKSKDDVVVESRCDGIDVMTLSTLCDEMPTDIDSLNVTNSIEANPTYSAEYLDEVLTCRRIKKAISEGITDPVQLAEAVGIPVCTLARHAGNYPGIDLQAAGPILVQLNRASWWQGVKFQSTPSRVKPTPSLAGEKEKEIEDSGEINKDVGKVGITPSIDGVDCGIKADLQRAAEEARKKEEHARVQAAKYTGKPPLICAKCGEDLTGHGQITKGEKVYCARPGGGYPARDTDKDKHVTESSNTSESECVTKRLSFKEKRARNTNHNKCVTGAEA